MKTSPLLAATLVAVLGVVGVARFAVARSSFVGQGSVAFDSIQVGRNLADKIDLYGTVLNSRSGKPVTIGDDLSVTGATALSANLNVAGSTTLKGSLTLNGFGSFTDGLIVYNLTDLNGGAYITGNVAYTGSLMNGTTNVTTRINTNATVTTAITGFLDCIGQASQFTTYIQSSDFRTCFNSWLAGQPKNVP